MNRNTPSDAEIESAFDHVEFPADWDATEAEEWCIALERLADYDRTGLYYTPDDVKGWLEARRRGPDAPVPPARCKFG
jgi:hypothetical protein